MESYLKQRDKQRKSRAFRNRKKIKTSLALTNRLNENGTIGRLRLSVHKSNAHFYAQIIDDEAGITLAHASSLNMDKEELKGKKPVEIAGMVGRLVATKAKAKGITAVALDRGRFAYMGQVKQCAESAREAGLTL